MMQKIGMSIATLIVVTGLVGCGSEDGALQESNGIETVANADELNEEAVQAERETEKEPAEAAEKSYAEKHPELDQKIMNKFDLDQEYSDTATEFFSESTYTDLYVGELHTGDDHATFYVSSEKESSEMVDKKVFTVNAAQYPPDQFQFGHAKFRFKIFRDAGHKDTSVRNDRELFSAQTYMFPPDMDDYFVDFTNNFDAVWTYEGGTGTKYVFYKDIPLRDGYILEVRLVSDKHSIIEHLDELNFRLDNITVNPVLLEE